MKGSGRWIRRLGRGLAIVGVVLAVLAVRVVTASKAELAEGDRLLDMGEANAAIAHYRRAAGWYAPGNPYCLDALQRLASLGRRAEEDGDARLALTAWRAVRAGIMSARSFYTPNAERLREADEHIAMGMAAEEPAPIDAGRSREELRREYLEMLRDTPRPSPAWAFVLLIGFAAWVGAAYAFATRAVDGEDRLVPAEARRWGTVFIVGFGLFVVGMLLA